jgi:endonuclease/exonuclease/phosphatase family metal-dependent hydrolase
MLRVLRRISVSFLVLSNLAVGTAYLAACWAARLDPAAWPHAGFLVLFLPYLMALLVVHGLLWLMTRPVAALPTLLLLQSTFGTIREILPLHPGDAFTGKKAEGSLRVMSWNLRSFTPFEEDFLVDGSTIRHGFIFDEVSRFSPDVVCFQEFTDAAKSAGKDPVAQLRRKLGYRYHYFPGDDFFKGPVLNGPAIFSRHRILRAGQVRYPTGRYYDNEHTLWADILWKGDTVRVHVMHLQSYRFLPRDYRILGRMEEDSEGGARGMLMMYRKLRRTFVDHGEQSRWLRRIVDTSRHPAIVCVDLNDVPASYAYRTLLADGVDAFAERGTGFGRTYISPQSRWMGLLPTLRIDHILTDASIETVQVTRGRPRLSDHCAVVADLRIPENE